VAGNINLPRHQAADTDYSSNYQDMQIETFLREKAFFLSIIEWNVAQGRPRDTDEEALCRFSLGGGHSNRK
jgi:hypothetical protein